MLCHILSTIENSVLKKISKFEYLPTNALTSTFQLSIEHALDKRRKTSDSICTADPVELLYNMYKKKKKRESGILNRNDAKRNYDSMKIG